MQPAIVVVAYNRPDCLKRLLYSLSKANYLNISKTELIISIDGGDNKNVIEVAENFKWEFGTKAIIKHGKNIGLRNHVLSCGDLSDKFGSVIVLEDDMFVSNDFYNFAIQALEKYKNCSKIAGISLYSYSFCEFTYAPFIPLSDGFDVYFMQVPSSLGQIWTKTQWTKFKTNYQKSTRLINDYSMPEKVFNWPESSWKKYFYKYIVENDLFFVFPEISKATNFGDIGTHFPNEVQIFQVPMSFSQNKLIFNFPSFEESINKYDAFWEILPESLKKLGFETNLDYGVDLNGLKNVSKFNNEYFVTIKKSTSPYRTFAFRMIPAFSNLLYEIHGHEITIAKKEFIISRIENHSQFIDKFLNMKAFILGYSQGRESIISTKTYRLGLFMLVPLKLLLQLKNMIIKFLFQIFIL